MPSLALFVSDPRTVRFASRLVRLVIDAAKRSVPQTSIVEWPLWIVDADFNRARQCLLDPNSDQKENVLRCLNGAKGGHS